jgi:hypothetical protein
MSQAINVIFVSSLVVLAMIAPTEVEFSIAVSFSIVRRRLQSEIPLSAYDDALLRSQEQPYHLHPGRLRQRRVVPKFLLIPFALFG